MPKASLLNLKIGNCSFIIEIERKVQSSRNNLESTNVKKLNLKIELEIFGLEICT